MKKTEYSAEYVSPEMEVQLIFVDGVICQSNGTFNGDGFEDFSRENPDWF